MTVTNEYFIKIENEFITEGNELHLNDKELYLYSLLYMDRRMDGTVMTTLSLLSSFMHIRYSSQDVRNVKALKDSLNGLLEKGTLTATNNDGEIIEAEKLKASDAIRVSFPEVESKGHVQIPYSKLEMCSSLQEYYIFTAVKRWENAKEDKQGIFKCDYDRFARILGVARSTAQRNIDEAVENGVIYRNTGDYIDNGNGSQMVQGLNEYKIIPFDNNQKSVMTKKKENEEKYSDDDVYDDYENEDMYYGHGDIDDAYGQWSIFEDELTNEQLAPDSESHLMGLLVENNLKKRKPTKIEEKFMDKVKWRTGLMLKTTKGTEEWEKAHEEAKYHFENMLLGISDDEPVEVSVVAPIVEMENLADVF